MGMDIAVLGVDLGKNVCSVVGLDTSDAVVMRRKVRHDTLIALAEKLPRALWGWRPAAALTASAGCLLRMVMTCVSCRPNMFGPMSRRRRTTIGTPRDRGKRRRGRRCGSSN